MKAPRPSAAARKSAKPEWQRKRTKPAPAPLCPRLAAVAAKHNIYVLTPTHQWPAAALDDLVALRAAELVDLSPAARARATVTLRAALAAVPTPRINPDEEAARAAVRRAQRKSVRARIGRSLEWSKDNG
jgi:hypothetical protein